MSSSLNFQELILRLHQFWSQRGCIIWQPYSEKVGAGTMNPATVLSVLGTRALECRLCGAQLSTGRRSLW